MRLALPALGAAILVGAAIVWTPLPATWVDGASADLASAAPAPTAIISPAAVAVRAGLAAITLAPDADPTTLAGNAPIAEPGPPVLVGLIGAGARRIAYVMAGNQTVRAAVGDKVGAWRLASIGAHEVTLRAGGKSLALALYGPRPQPPPVIAAAPDAPTPVAPSTAPAPAAIPRMHALEPASAPPPRAQAAGPHPKYWVGPAASMPPGYVLWKPEMAP
jgi:hypothetical protein